MLLGFTMRSQVYVAPLDDEAAYFVAIYARFDYAVKRAGWTRGQESLISWGKVSDALGPGFFDFAEPHATYLAHSPPRDLVMGEKGWHFPDEAPQPVRSTLGLLKAVAQVRNNLLHGEKLYWSDRDRLLVADAGNVLAAAILWSGQRELTLHRHYHESPGSGRQ
jgi:hypothetical protein